MQKLQPQNVLGCDLSNNNGHVDFSGFKSSGIQFVYLKATEGSTYLDRFFAENMQKAKAAGIPAAKRQAGVLEELRRLQRCRQLCQAMGDGLCRADRGQ